MKTAFLTGLILVAVSALGVAPPAEKKVVHAKELPPIKYKYNSLLGLGLARGSSLVVGGQLAFPLSQTSPVFAGPELDFALYSPGSLYALLGTFWYEIPLDRTTKSALSLGVATGMVAADRPAYFPSLTYAAFLDIALSQEVDQDVSVRGQIRPGIIGKYFAFWMNMNVTFLIR